MLDINSHFVTFGNVFFNMQSYVEEGQEKRGNGISLATRTRSIQQGHGQIEQQVRDFGKQQVETRPYTRSKSL